MELNVFLLGLQCHQLSSLLSFDIKGADSMWIVKLGLEAVKIRVSHHSAVERSTATSTEPKKLRKPCHKPP